MKQPLGIGSGVGYKLSHTGIGKKAFQDLNFSRCMQLREHDEQTVPWYVRGDNRLWKVECENQKKFSPILNWFFEFV